MAELSPSAFGFPQSAGPQELDPSAFGFDAPAKPTGGLSAAAKQAIGSTIKGVGQAATDFLPGVTAANPVSAYGQSVIDANPTATNSLGDYKPDFWPDKLFSWNTADPETLQPVQYYCKLPDHMEDRIAIVVDPMLATGNSSAAAVSLLKAAGARQIRFLCLLAAPEGVARMKEAHPDVPIVTAALDSHLNDHGYIVPGLGDAGDRMFGTK